MLPSSESRRSRRTRGEEPEYEGAPPSQRVTPPRTSQEEEGQGVPIGADLLVSPEHFATARHTLGDVLPVFYDAQNVSDGDSTATVEGDRADDILAPVSDEDRQAGVDTAVHVLTGGAQAMALDGDRENGFQAAIDLAARKLAALEAKLAVWKDQFIDRDLQAVRDVSMRVQLNPADSSLRERLREAYDRAKARREAILAERFRWETLIFEAECPADESDAKMTMVTKTYQDVDDACRGELLEKAKKLIKDPDDGLSGADSKLFKLPAVEVPSFKGSLAEFPSFERAFQAVIGKSKLPDQYKLVHLKNALKGETTGLNAIVGTEAADYGRLWNLLHARYGNASSLRAQVMADFMGLKNKASEGPKGLRKLHDGVVAKYNRLKEVDPAAANRKEWVMMIIQPLYPREIRRRICEKLQEEEPDIDVFLENAELLISREMRMEHADQVNPLNGKDPPKTRTGNNNGKPNNKKPGGFPPQGTTTGFAVGDASSRADSACQGDANQSCKQAACAAPTSRKNQSRKTDRPSRPAGGRAKQSAQQDRKGKVKPCHCCKAECGTLQCKKFLALSTDKKREVLKKAKVCFNCLRSMESHSGVACYTFAKCKKCERKHWTQLHELHTT